MNLSKAKFPCFSFFSKVAYFSKAKLSCFNFFNKVTYLMSLQLALSALIYSRFTLVILIVLIAECSTSTILDSYIRKYFSIIRELDRLLSDSFKFFHNCRILTFCDISSYVIEISCLGPGFVKAVFGTILSILLSKI